jgi:ketosteroid isomerase-like protein
MKNSIFICLLSLFVVWGCQDSPRALSEAENEKIKTEVKAEFESLVESIRELDFDKWSGFYSQDYFISSVNGRLGYITNYEQWMKAVDDSFSSRSRHKSKTLEVNINVLSSNLALLTFSGIWENWWGDNYNKVNGLASYLWNKENDTWKVVHVHESIKRNIDLIGAWNMVEVSGVDNGNDFEMLLGGSEMEQIKSWTNSHFFFIGKYPSDNGTVDSYGGGTYVLDGNLYEEHVKYNFSKSYEGTTVKMLIEVEGDTLFQTYPVDDEGLTDKENYTIEKYVRLE